MATLFAVIVLVGLVSFIVFGFKSILIISRKQDAKKDLKKTGISLLVAIAALAGVGVTAPEAEVSTDLAVSKITDDIEKVESDNATINDNLSVDAYTQRVSKVFKEMGAKTNLKILSVIEQKDGSTIMRLSNDTFISISTSENVVNQLSLHMEPDAFYESSDDFKFAFLLLEGTADTTLSMGERNFLLRELGLDDEEVFKKKFNSNSTVGIITYSYEGDAKNGYTLKAEW